MKNRFKLESFVAIIIILVNLFFVFSPVYVSKVSAQVYSYTYYGYVPAKIIQYNLTDPKLPPSESNKWRLNTGSPSNASVVVVAGMKDNTHVKISYLNGTLVSETTISKMQKHYVIFRNDTFFKVETDELACVLLLNFGARSPLSDESIATFQNCSQAVTLWAQNCRKFSSYPLPFTLYQDINGAYAGKNFILMAVQYNIYLQYTIFALEKAEVTVTREDGDIKQYTIAVNGYKRLLWEPFTTYKIESTGNIMIHSGNVDTLTFFVPAVEGGFVGRNFYTLSRNDWDTGESYGYRVSATQNSKITVWNLETKAQILTANVPANSGFGFKPTAPAICVQSDQPVTLELVNNGSIERASSTGTYGAYGSGVGYFGVKPNEDTPFFLAVDSYVQAYIFASEDTQVTVDGTNRTIKANSYYLVTEPGMHVINSNKKVVVETLNWPNTPDYQGLQYNGIQITSIQTGDIVTNITLTPIGEGFPIMYIIIGAVAAAISVIVVFLFMRNRGKK